MPNEFKVKNGLIVDQGGISITGSSSLSGSLDISGSTTITGSLNVSSGITGSLYGTASWANNVISSSYALTASYALNAGGAVSAFPYTGSARITGSINLTGSIYVTQSTISTVDWIDFTVNPGTPPHSEGRIHWNVDRKTLEVDTDVNNFMIPTGHASVLRGRNTNSYTLTKGTVVYINGNSGQFATFGTASWEDDPRSAYTIGIVAQDINTNNYGYAVTDGEITGINTNAYAPATLLYLSSSGQYTDVKPIAPNHTVRLGQVVVQSTNGILQVKVDNGYETDELHDVLLNNTSSGDLFVKSGSLWINSKQLTGSYGLTGSINITGSLRLSTPTYNTSSINVLTYNTASTDVEYSTINDLIFTKNIVNVGLSGSRGVRYNVIKSAVQSITDASENNTYTVRVAPGIYIEDTITVPSWVAIKGDSSISTVVSASNPSSSIFVMSDQSMVIDMQIQGSTAPSASAVYYSSPTTPQRNAIAYVENVRFGTNYTNAKVVGSGSSGNCILQCSNVKYGGYTDTVSQKSFDVGFYVTSGSSGGIGRMQLRNVTSTNGGVAGTDNNQIFALADAPGCTFIVNGCLLTRATGTARGTAFKVYNGGQLRLTAVNFQRWINGIWAPQTGSAPSIDAIALNFENCTTDVLIQHTGSTGKVQGTDNFLKTQIALNAPLYEVGQDPRKITVGTKGADFTSISASVAYITDSSANNRYVIDVGPGQFTENMIDLTGKPYVSIVGSNIQTTQIFPSSSTQHIIKMGINNEVSFLSLANAGPGYSALYVDDVGDFAQAHKISIYDCDRGVTVNASTTDTQFYGEYIDINGTFSYGTYVSSSDGASVDVSMENYFLFPSASAAVGNFVVGPSSSLGVRSSVLTGDGTAGLIAFQLQDGATLEASSVDIPDWDTAVYVPNAGSGPTFRIVGTMIHNSSTYDFNIQNSTTVGRFQGISDHSKINNVSDEFYWNFLDDTDGENDVTRKLSVTFADGTHTDATTLIFKGSPMGVMQGGTITISSGLTITTAAGFGYLQDSINTDVYKRLDWNNTNITLAANTNNYIYLNDNGILSASGTAPDSATNIILGRVVTNDTGVEFIDQTPYDGEHTANKLSKFNREALGPVFAEGSIVTENVTPFKLNVTQGNYYFSENNFLPSGTSSINLTQYYQSASVWARYTSSIVPSNVYASASILAPMSASYYTKHTVYLVGQGVDEEYFLVINNNQYSTLISAENADLPTIPTYFNDGVVPLAAVYVQSGSANITQIQDIRPIIGFRAAGVNASSVHGNLLGLSADDHTQYLLVDGGRQMSGDLGLGGNDLYNVSTVSASAITASGAIITDIQATSITGSLLGTATNALTASYFITSSVTSASFASTSSLALNFFTASVTSASYARTASAASNFVVGNNLTASNALISNILTVQTIIAQTITSSVEYITGSTQFGSILTNTHQFTGSVSITGSLNVVGPVSASNFTGSLFGTASWANNFFTSSVTNATSASLAATASYFFTSSVTNATSASLAATASYFFTSSVTSASFASSSSLSVSSSYALTASYALNAGGASAITIADEGTSQGTATFLNFTGAGVTATVSSNTASISISGGSGNAFPYTGSAQITGSLGVTGSISVIDGGFTGSLFGTASSAINAITSSYPFTVSGSVLYSVAPYSYDVNGQELQNNIFIGENAGSGSSGFYASNTINIGKNSGYNSFSRYSVNIGIDAGSNAAPSNGYAVSIGNRAGSGSLNGDYSVMIGTDAGFESDTFNAAFIGYGAGYQNTTGNPVAIGFFAGQTVTGSAQRSIYIGYDAGGRSHNADYSTFIGQSAGYGAYNAAYSTFIGSSAGADAINANNSFFVGYVAGNNAVSASYSTIIGRLAGYTTTNNLIGRNNIIIGTKVTLENGRQDSINIGGIIFGTGSYFNASFGNAFSGSANGRIGINVVNPVYTLDVDGNGNFTNGVTASLFGTASWANNFFTSSVTNATSASLAATASYFFTSSVTNATSASYSSTASYFFTSSVTNATSASLAATASYFFTSSVTNATSASFASTASYFFTSSVTNATSASLAATASYFFTSSVTNTTSASFASTASYFFTSSVTNATSASLAATASYFFTSSVTNATSASLAATASYFFTSSVTNATSASYSSTASAASNFIVGSSITASNALITGTLTAQTLVVQVITSSVSEITGSTQFGNLLTDTHQFTGSVSITGSLNVVGPVSASNFTGSLFGTSSWANNFFTSSVTSASFATSSSLSVSSSYAVRADQVNGFDGSVLIYTGSQNVTQRISGSLQMSGSLVMTGSISSLGGFTGSLLGTASWAQNAVSASYVTGSIHTSNNLALSSSYAITASFALNAGGGGLTTKAGSVANSSFTGNPKKATVTFSTAFGSTNYAIVVTGEDARSWTIESKAAGSFVINANSNTGLAGTTYWIATAYGET